MASSHPKFQLNSILRGVQLTLVGAIRVLRNPNLLKTSWFQLAALAICLGIALKLVLSIPTVIVKSLLWALAFFTDLESAAWDERLVLRIDFIAHTVLQLPLFLMRLIHHTGPGGRALDACFMESLSWVDSTYQQKHENGPPRSTRAMYYPNLVLYSSAKHEHQQRSLASTLPHFLRRQGKKAAVSMAVLGLSCLPLLGRFVMPAASFFTFKKAVGAAPATLVFGLGLFLPKEYLIIFLQTYYSSRSFAAQLLKPYLSRVRFSTDQRRLFLMERQDVLFGFSLGFFILLKTPLPGLFPVIYGIAEASTAYLITKVTDPAPPPAFADAFVESQVRWQNKHEFLRLPFQDLDYPNTHQASNKNKRRLEQYEEPEKQLS